MAHGPIPDKPTQRLIDAALKLADVHDETIDGEWGSSYGETRTDEAEAVRAAVVDLGNTVPTTQ
jgi:hypothetical protein